MVPAWLFVLALLAAPALLALGVGVGAFLYHRAARGQPPVPWPLTAPKLRALERPEAKPDRDRPAVPRVGA